jgi:5-formyltetrahydrofolate cyclo-ligase
MDPKPLTIGVGYQLGHIETIHPQLHDVPMDAIVTEAGVASVTDASPPRQREALALQDTNLE